MRFLFVMGASGTGKTTLAKKIGLMYPEDYTKVLQTTTRPMRDGEIDGDECKFITEEEYKKIRYQLLTRSEIEFAPNKYGTPIDNLCENKTNILVTSIEGFLNSISNLDTYTNSVHLLYIKNDVDCDVARSGRNPEIEDIMNMAVLSGLFNYSEEMLKLYNKWIVAPVSRYVMDLRVIRLSELKTVRDDVDRLKKLLDL